VLVLVGAFAAMHLAKISGELGLLIASGSYVRVRGHDLAPGLQAASRLAFDCSRGRTFGLLTGLLLKAYPEYFLLLPPHVYSFLG
jgi:hypothetical protein